MAAKFRRGAHQRRGENGGKGVGVHGGLGDDRNRRRKAQRRWFDGGPCDISCTCKLDIYFVSVKYVLVSVKLVYVYGKLLKI
jgi:hypothetical protein